MENSGNALGLLAIVFVVLILFFLVCREIVCWYLKINRRIALLTEIRDLLVASGSSEDSRASKSSASAPRREPSA